MHLPKGMSISIPTAMYHNGSVVLYNPRYKGLGKVMSNGHWMLFGRSLEIESVQLKSLGDTERESVIPAHAVLKKGFEIAKAVGVAGSWRYDIFSKRISKSKKLQPVFDTVVPKSGEYVKLDTETIAISTADSNSYCTLTRSDRYGDYNKDSKNITHKTEPSTRCKIEIGCDTSFVLAIVSMGGKIWGPVKDVKAPILEPMLIASPNNTVVGMLMPSRI